MNPYRDTEVEVEINRFPSIDGFYMRSKFLTHEDYKLMETARKIRFNKTGALMYAARPYTTEIGEIKLFFPFPDEPCRCQIKDMYTIAVYEELRVYVDIFMIDKGYHVSQIPIHMIFDFPQRINYYKDLKPEASLARLYLGHPIPDDYKDAEIDEYFCETMRNSSRKNFLIKILDYKQETYYVDIIDAKKNSVIQHIREKFKNKVEKFEDKLIDAGNIDDLAYIYQRSFHNFKPIEIPRKTYCLSKIVKKKTKHYNGVLDYFKQLENDINMSDDRSKFYLMKHLYRVKVLRWRHPEEFYIIPDDPEYANIHENFKRELDAYGQLFEKDKEDSIHSQRTYKLGQKCLFQNEIDSSLSKWLRGVVIEVPKIDCGFLKITTTQYEASYSAHLVYRIRSIDYGFQCERTSANLRPVDEKDRLFYKREPWSLRCRLFGIDRLRHELDLYHEQGFSDSCLRTIDNWVRMRTYTDRSAFFYILFRNDVFKTPKLSPHHEPSTEISLFHKLELPCSLTDSFSGKQKYRYDSLNSYLINKGLVSDHMHKLDKSSHVDLDEYIINFLENSREH